MSKKPLKTDKSGYRIMYISIAFLRKTRSLNTLRLLQFSIFFHESFRIIVELNFALNLLLGFSKKIAALF